MIKDIVSLVYYNTITMGKYISILRKRGAVIGENCDIYQTVKFGSEPYLISIGDNVRVNDGCSLITHDGGLWVLRNLAEHYNQESFRRADKFGRFIIANNSIIMPGVHIGNNVIIGCGAVVTHDVPSNTVWGGIPAKQIETIDEYVEKIRNSILYTKGLSYSKKKKY